MEQTVRIAGQVKHSAVDGPGVRYTLFLQGCPHGCRACQNPETHDPEGGTERDLAEVIDEILSTRFLDGITLSGGDPFLQPEASMAIARAAPSVGSVPAPSSSKRTREYSSAFFINETTLVI